MTQLHRPFVRTLLISVCDARSARRRLQEKATYRRSATIHTPTR